ncbi:MAG TPA: flagellar biosynthesis anti-sigma factor FlgM [Anaeromyxobacteraceae bacterium]|nr:flagellar biosynthesis anti-sigma factor FlgM [Anaeromyxobacteraceae bacterium]
MKVKDASEARRVEASRPQESRRTPAAPPATVDDKVSVEAQARIDAAVQAARSATGDARSVQLAEIEAAIRQGTFRPDPQRIAQRILDEAAITAMLQAMMKR